MVVGLVVAGEGSGSGAHDRTSGGAVSGSLLAVSCSLSAIAGDGSGEFLHDTTSAEERSGNGVGSGGSEGRTGLGGVAGARTRVMASAVAFSS